MGLTNRRSCDGRATAKASLIEPPVKQRAVILALRGAHRESRCELGGAAGARLTRGRGAPSRPPAECPASAPRRRPARRAATLRTRPATRPACSRKNGLPSSPYHSGDPRRDRKSTRLNSSHSQISYAVFCLKKKNDVHNSP